MVFYAYNYRYWTISIILSAPNPVGFILLANVKGRFFSKSTIIGSILKYFLPKNWKIVIRLGTTDRIIDIVQALEEYPDKNLIIIDLGTATTFDVLKKNVYVGGAILPGIEMSINALCGNTAKLPKVKFTTPECALGSDTISQIQSGIFYGYAGQIKHIIRKMKEEVGEECFVVATGGLGKILSAEIDEIDVYKADLSIKGLYTLYQNNKTK